MHSICPIIIKGEVSNYILPYYLNLVVTLWHIYALYCVALLTIFAVFSKMTFIATFYIYAVFKLLLLL